jgi:hypothetical protein
MSHETGKASKGGVHLYATLGASRPPVTHMEDLETASQLLAQETRTLQLLNFRFMQLRLTNDQLMAALQDLLAQKSLIDQASPAADGDEPPP